MKTALAAIVAMSLCLPNSARANITSPGTASPDGHLKLTVIADESSQLRFSVSRDGQTLIAPSTLGITVDSVDFGNKARASSIEVPIRKADFPVVGGHTRATVEYSDAVVTLHSGSPEVKWTMEFRVFNDAVAYRYRIPGQGLRRVKGESGEWRLPAKSQVWFHKYDRGDYEATNQHATADDPVLTDCIAAPALFKLPGDDGYAFLTEANLVRYTDMALRPRIDGSFGVLLRNDDQGFDWDGDILTPWRVALLAKDLHSLVNSDVIQALADAPAKELANADWIKPGRAAWHWRVTFQPKFDQQKQWVDYAAALGFEFYLVDDGWRDWKAEGKDSWAMLKEVVDYAASKNVKVWAWVDSKYVKEPAERQAYFKKAKDLGIVGLKIDFMGRANVWWTQWYEDASRDAADARLMLDFHGALKPSGRERTWPNELTREAVGGREQGKLPGLHDTTVPFLRQVQGHADYTPTDFRPKEMKGNTVAKELAGAIVYTSPLLCYSGDPKDYLASPSLDVIKAIPSTWDETIVLPGSAVGEVAAFARRKGDTWFVGVINGTTPRTMPIALSFLKAGSYTATLLGDTEGDATTFDKQQKTVSATDTLQTKLSKDGGYVAMFKPAK